MTQNVGKQENLRFDGVKFYAVHFDILGEPAENTDINLDVTPKVFYHSETKFDIVYDVELTASDVFKINIRSVGYFELSQEILKNINIKKQLINTNAPAIAFPYIRSFISAFTANLGTIPSLTIPTHFFKGELEEFND
ncbi:MAG: protein-export chaperone SecB [Ekhidna sp.]|nr:protein-export chaperone SecB [Ekhidna sp.]MBC6409938.1 protein-export chaperone SecB [Ekhidna sp.]